MRSFSGLSSCGIDEGCIPCFHMMKHPLLKEDLEHHLYKAEVSLPGHLPHCQESDLQNARSSSLAAAASTQLPRTAAACFFLPKRPQIQCISKTFAVIPSIAPTCRPPTLLLQPLHHHLPVALGAAARSNPGTAGTSAPHFSQTTYPHYFCAHCTTTCLQRSAPLLDEIQGHLELLHRTLLRQRRHDAALVLFGELLVQP
eukprot:1156347-Pelagomonas_calceolata.AAC.9